MSYHQFIALVNCMKHTKGGRVIEKKGASYPLYVKCAPEGVSVEKYGGPHAYEQLDVPRELCKSLSETGEEGFINLAIFQSEIIRHYDGKRTEGEQRLGAGVDVTQTSKLRLNKSPSHDYCVTLTDYQQKPLTLSIEQFRQLLQYVYVKQKTGNMDHKFDLPADYFKGVVD